MSHMKVQPWFERTFDPTFPIEQFPVVRIRLQGTPARLDDMLRDVPHEILVRKEEGKWSAQEHVGHLLDLEPLWSTRVNDYLTGASQMTPADLSNRKTHEARHNERALPDIVREFRHARARLLDLISGVPTGLLERPLMHPRLKQPLRLIDHLYFAAEHDDHDLATIWEVIHTA